MTNVLQSSINLYVVKILNNNGNAKYHGCTVVVVHKYKQQVHSMSRTRSFKVCGRLIMEIDKTKSKTTPEKKLLIVEMRFLPAMARPISCARLKILALNSKLLNHKPIVL